ncbi:hypothetical protein L873DRAFT_1818708, partial [Choiromyces venosus 120613-1]
TIGSLEDQANFGDKGGSITFLQHGKSITKINHPRPKENLEKSQGKEKRKEVCKSHNLPV